MYILPNILFDDLPLGLEVFFLRLVITLGFTSVKDIPGINSLMPNRKFHKQVDIIGISSPGTCFDIFTSYDMLRYI